MRRHALAGWVAELPRARIDSMMVGTVSEMLESVRPPGMPSRTPRRGRLRQEVFGAGDETLPGYGVRKIVG